MAAPTASVQNEVLVASGTGTGTTLDTNAASRQLVRVYNNGPDSITIIPGTGTTVTLGVGVVIYPGGSEWFWLGTGVRLQARNHGTATQATGAATIVAEDS